MAILKPEVVGWSARSLMLVDDHERLGGNDGFVDLSDIQAYRESLEERRIQTQEPMPRAHS